MRRVVPKELRKKALFSCDRCKSKKIACKRVSSDGITVRYEATSDACAACKDKGVECKTTIQRRRKSNGPVVNIGFHYRVLTSLVEGLFPDVDVNNVDVLIQLGREMNITMPSRLNLQEDSSQALQELEYQVKSHVENEPDGPKMSFEDDKFILDARGVSHYIGPSSNANIMGQASAMMASNPEWVTSDFLERFEVVYKEDAIVSSDLRPLKEDVLLRTDIEHFPYVQLDKQKMDKHVHTFFSKIFQYYFCFNKDRFMKLYASFFHHKLTSPETCFVYMVIIMGYHYQPSRNKEEAYIITRIMNVVKLSLGEFLLTPTMDGILCLFFLAVFFNKNKRRECGYMLITLACRQAIAIGLNRQSMIECNPSPDAQEEMKRIWWALFDQEAKFSVLLGRVSSVSLKESTVDFPSTSCYDDMFFLYEIKLLQVLHDMNQIMPKYSGVFHITPKYRAHIVKIRIYFQKWYDEVGPYMQIDVPEVKAFQYRLIEEAKYYQIALLLPFVVNICHKESIQEVHEYDLQMVVDCVKLTFDLYTTLVACEEHCALNRFYSPHVLYLYQCTLCYCMIFVWMSNHNLLEIADSKGNFFTFEDLKQYMKGFRNYNKQKVERSEGSISKLSKYIEIMLGSFHFVTESPSHGVLDLEYFETLRSNSDVLGDVFGLNDDHIGDIFSCR